MNPSLRALVRKQAYWLWLFSFGACRSDKNPGAQAEIEVEKLRGRPLVSVDGQELTDEYLLAVKEQLQPYANALYSGPSGDKALLASLVDLELLFLEAQAAGLEWDPRVHWAPIEAKAQRQSLAIQERRVPRSALEQDNAQLAAALSQHADQLTDPEGRAVWFAPFDTWRQAYEALDALKAGQLDPAQLESHGTTKAMKRNDEVFPIFHRLLFDPGLSIGDYLPEPVPVDGKLWVVRLSSIEPASPFSLEDPSERALVVEAAIQAPQRDALTAYLQELAKIWPLTPP